MKRQEKDTEKEKLLTRNCPTCGKILYYRTGSLYNRANKIGRGCRCCGQKFTKVRNGYKTWNKGLTKETDDRVKRASEHPSKSSKETRQKLRVSCGNLSCWRYNPKAIPIIEAYGEKCGYNFQHAENGGEVKIAGFFVDGYDKEKNIVIEFQEKYHRTPRQMKRDRMKKAAITKKINCKYIEIMEWSNEIVVNQPKQK